jgi:L-threonylcarbamoyladenylate synthase
MNAKLLEFKPDLDSVIDVLKKGGIIVYPTDTIWGIGCDATNVDAVSRIFEIKERTDTKSMLVLLDSVQKLPLYVRQVPELAWDLVELAEKPTTIIYPEGINLASNLLAADGSIGIRITKDEFCIQLLRTLGKPLVSTSANISGMPSQALFKDIGSKIISKADYVVSYRRNDKTIKPPSSIIRLGIDNSIKIIRS